VHGHQIFRWKMKPKSRNPCHIAKRPLFLFNINPQSTNFKGHPRIFENNCRYTPSHNQKLQMGHYKLLSPYICIHNSYFGYSCTKILRITSSFILCIHLTHVCCILLIDCVCFMLGNAVLEPFFEDFQDQAFEESQFFFTEQQGKCP
jgi:hypothetical protein